MEWLRQRRICGIRDVPFMPYEEKPSKKRSQAVAAPASRSRYRLPDMSVGDANAADPLETYSWQDLRGLIYGEPESQ